MEEPRDPYIRTESDIIDPPVSFRGKLKHIGPGFILTASVVGSGELIATTTLGAQAGFVTFWIIIVSCLVKVTIQVEFGKHAIYSGESILTAFNKLPGKKFGQAHWTIWAYFLLMVSKISQVAGILGGVAIIMNIAFPQYSVLIWTILGGILAGLLVFQGYYKILERVSIYLIALFTAFTFASVYFLQFTEYAFSLSQVLSGLEFNLPKAAVAVAIAAFGITGVGGDEIMAYNYWCLEKGYASHTGPTQDTSEWRARAKGWMKVIQLDAIFAMIVYTSVTAAFYLLGASVLHARGDIPEGFAMIETLSTMYTETLGPQFKTVFLVGGVVVLFSTVFSALASWTRQYSDIFGQIGWINFYKIQERKRSISILAGAFPLLWIIMFLFMQTPVLMVLWGGFVTSIILFLVVYVALYFRFNRLPPEFKPSIFYDTALWASALTILWVGAYGLFKLL